MSNHTPIIVISSGKGGVAKTTLAACLADYWSSLGLKVGALNTDPNRSLSGWISEGQMEGYFPNVLCAEELQRDQIIDKARDMVDAVDILIIDMAGLASGSQANAVGIADLVITPLTAGKDDIRESILTMGLVKEVAAHMQREIPCYALLTRANTRTTASRHTLNTLASNNFPLLNTVMRERTGYSTARFFNTTPVTHDPKSDPVADIEAIAREIGQQLGWAGTLGTPVRAITSKVA